MSPFKIALIIIMIITLLVVYTTTKKIIKVINSNILMKRDIEMYKLNYSEVDILNHLNFIIDECLDYYIAISITPKNIYYITNNIENAMINKLTQIVPERISPTLYSKLSLIYDPSQIAIVIGEKIYIKVLEYVIQFNVENNKEKNDKK